ncbi:MAG: acyl carrier protein [Gammaproteobacteria bacterium]|nr:acyl carrier protein [Gammaproteobacteria bacterium]
MKQNLAQDLLVRIQAIFSEQLRESSIDTPEIAVDTPLLGKGVGLDSIEALALVTRIEEEFGIFFDDEELTVELFRTIGTLAEQVRRKLAETSVTG